MATTQKAFRAKSGLIVELGALYPAAGTTSYAPIVLTSGTNLTSASAGAFEYDGTNFYLTPSTTRKTIAFTDSNITGSSASVSNAFTLKADSGTTEGTDLYTFTGASAKTVNIVGGTGISISKASGSLTITATGAGTVTSVTGTSPVVSSGGTSPAISLASGYGDTQNPYASKTANYVLAAPNGSSGAPTFRALVKADIPGVNNSLVIKSNTGTTEGTDLYTFDGSAAKTLNIVNGSNVTITASAGQLSIASTDTNYYPTAFSWTGGTTAGPTGSLTGSGMSAVSYAAIPSAAVGASGIVTTGTQEFGGTKTLTSPSITTSLTTTSTTFALVNTTATTVNFAGAATAVNIGASTGTTTINNDAVITGNLTVNGTTTTINSTTITVDDKNIELGSIASPTDTTADGAGITVLGATNKTWNWINATSSWTSSENIDLASGKVLKIAGTQVLSATNYTGNSATVTNGVYTTNLGTNVLTALGVAVGTDGAFVVKGGALGTPSSGTLTNATGLPISTGVSGLGTGVATALAVNVGSSGAIVVNGGALGTPTSGTLTNATGLPISTGVSGLGTGIATFLATPSSANLAAALTDETGTGAVVFAGSPALTGSPTLNAVATSITASGTGATSSSPYTSATLFTATTGGANTAAKLLVKIMNTVTYDIEIIEMLVGLSGWNTLSTATVYITQYGDIQSNSALATVTATNTSGAITVTVTPLTTNAHSISISGTVL